MPSRASGDAPAGWRAGGAGLLEQSQVDQGTDDSHQRHAHEDAAPLEVRQDEITEYGSQHRNDADHAVDEGEGDREARLAQHIPQHGEGHDVERSSAHPLPETPQIKLGDAGRLRRHQGGDHEDEGAPQHHGAPAMAIRQHAPRQHGSRHAQQIDGKSGMDLRLAPLQGLRNAGHGHQIEIDPEGIEDDHQKSTQQKHTHEGSIAAGFTITGALSARWTTQSCKSRGRCRAL